MRTENNETGKTPAQTAFLRGVSPNGETGSYIFDEKVMVMFVLKCRKWKERCTKYKVYFNVILVHITRYSYTLSQLSFTSYFGSHRARHHSYKSSQGLIVFHFNHPTGFRDAISTYPWPICMGERRDNRTIKCK